MNLNKLTREQTASRFLILLISSAIIAWAIAGPLAILWGIATVMLAPTVISYAAHFWANAAEWRRLAIAEEYGAAAQKRMEELARNDLRETLDPIGVEALEEVERAIARRDAEANDG